MPLFMTATVCPPQNSMSLAGLVGGDGQAGSAGALLPSPFRVRAETAAGGPIPGLTVRFSLAAAPPGATGAVLESLSVLTDEDGFAEVRLRLGSKG